MAAAVVLDAVGPMPAIERPGIALAASQQPGYRKRRTTRSPFARFQLDLDTYSESAAALVWTYIRVAALRAATVPIVPADDICRLADVAVAALDLDRMAAGYLQPSSDTAVVVVDVVAVAVAAVPVVYHHRHRPLVGTVDPLETRRMPN